MSQYIRTGRISGAALVGEGRAERIDVAEAERQLAELLDQGQLVARAVAGHAPRNNVVALDENTRRAAQARAQKLEIEAEMARRAMAAAAGQFMLAADAKRAWSREMAELVRTIGEDLDQMARAVAAELGVDERQARAVVRREWRAFRAANSTEAAARAAELPELVDDPERGKDREC